MNTGKGAKYGNTIAAQWHAYATLTASQNHLNESKRAFYAGAEALFEILMHAPIDENTSEALFVQTKGEFEAFAAAVKAGRE